ncbi:MAG: Nif3-like dinuclear metal center hexameric protein [Clostridiales Family XIII bacterium]|jgi:dinuclear metal center YbgI/SA1388 family protein|nr:Nif3-like dinuclear metal center hexameric protein [Clostridiales Family XIII bacterium]
MSISVRELIGAIEEKYPLYLQEAWDNSGWQIGLLDAGDDIKRVLVALEITRETVDEAVQSGAELIVEHHPLFFGKVAHIDASISAPGPEGAYTAALIGAGISVYAAHTTFDTADGGMNDALAGALGLAEVTGFPRAAGAATAGNQAGKDVGEFPRAAGAAIAGDQAGKDAGGFPRAEGIAVSGLPDGALGDSGEDGGKWMHPIGRKGMLPEGPVAFGEMIAKAEALFGMEGRIKSVGDPDAPVRTVAVCGGAGGDFVPDAIREGVDLYITSDVKHHEAQWAREKGLLLIDGGHWGTEKIFVPVMAAFIARRFGDRIDVIESKANQDPWK